MIGASSSDKQMLCGSSVTRAAPTISAVIDLRLAIDPLPPRGNFVHYDFLKLPYISHKMRHVSPLRVEALSCNNNITYVTL